MQHSQTTTPIYETGATSHAVNDLILFTDNTRELAALRDKIYQSCINDEISAYNMAYQFLGDLLPISRERYVNEFGAENSQHLFNMTILQNHEYATLYVNDFNNWKQEHGIN